MTKSEFLQGWPLNVCVYKSLEISNYVDKSTAVCADYFIPDNKTNCYLPIEMSSLSGRNTKIRTTKISIDRLIVYLNKIRQNL